MCVCVYVCVCEGRQKTWLVVASPLGVVGVVREKKKRRERERERESGAKLSEVA